MEDAISQHYHHEQIEAHFSNALIEARVLMGIAVELVL